MAYTLNRRLAQLVDSNGQLNTGKIPNDYITSDHVADNTITSAMLHTSFTVSTSNLTAIDTDDVSEGSSNLYFTNVRADARIAAATTDDLSEGSTNLYFTNARVDSHLSGGTGVTYSSGTISIGQDVGTTATPTFGNITTTGYIAGPATFTIDPAAVGNNTGTVVIAGNLQVDGTTTTINSTTMEVDDLNITLASGAADAAAANGAGITVDGASATITYDGTNDEWDFNKDINVAGNATITTAGSTVLLVEATGDNDSRVRVRSGTSNISYIEFADPDDADTGEIRYDHSTNSMQFRVNGNQEALTIDSNKNVGIGTSNPSHELEIHSASPTVEWSDSDNNYRSQITQSGSAFYFDSDTGAGGSSSMRFRINGGTEAMRISAGGNVGIGTDNPTHKFHIDSNGSSNSVLRIDADDNRGASRYALDIIDDDTNSRGSVRISTTSGQPVLIQHDTDGKGIQIDHTTVGGYSDILFTTKQNDGLQKVMHRLRSDMIDGSSGGEESEFSLYGMYEGSEKLGLRIDRHTNTFINSFTTYEDYSSADIAGSNYHEIGTWDAGQSSRITIRINGAIGFSNNLDHAGETVIHGTISNAGDFEGFFYGIGSNSTATAVAVKANGNAHTIYIIPGQYGSFESHVTITKNTIWTPKTSSHSTGSSSLPSGAVGLQSEFGVNISGSRKLLLNSSGNLELSNGLNSTAGTVQYSDGGSSFDSSNASGYAVFRQVSGSAQIGFERTGQSAGIGYIGADADNVFAIWDSSFNRKFRMTQSGDVGIGEGFTPQDKLHVESGSSDEITTFRVSTAGQVTIARNHSTGPSITSYMSSGIPRFDFTRNGVVETRVATNQDTWFNASTQGNVGIGTSSPGASIDVRRNTNTANNLDSLGFDVVGNIGNAASNPGNHYTSGLRIYQGSGTVGSGLGVMYLGADNGNATTENDYTGQISAPDGMSGGLRLNTFTNDAKIRFYTKHSNSTELRMDIDNEGIDIQPLSIYASSSASLTTTATDFYVNSTGTIGSGTYLLKIVLQGGGWYSETHVGIMQWYSGTTNNPTADTIHLTGMGHANTVSGLNARVLRKYSNTNTHSIQLWLDSGSSSNHNINMYVAKLQD